MDTPTTHQDWAEIIGLFRGTDWRRQLRWVNGVSPRMNARRIRQLLDLPAAGPLAALLDQRDDRRIKALRTFAAINLEQASAAMRMTVIVNVSIPVIVLTVLSQVTSGQFWTDVWERYLGGSHEAFVVAIPALVAALAVAIILGHGANRLGQARDIRHLIDLLAADRGIYFGLDDTDDLQSD